MSREASRPDIGTAPTEHAHHMRPPPPYSRPIKTFKDVESERDLLHRDLGEQQRALGYVESKVDRALREIHGEGDEPGLRGLVLVLTKSVRTTQIAMLILLSIIAASLAYMALHAGPQ
jgi:hypothetical protein